MAVYGPASSEELYHYGVLGMKWGVRHDKQSAYEKASKQATKNRDKYEKAKKKERAISYKISQRRMSMFKSRRNTTKLENKLESQTSKTIRRAQKGAKWYRNMEKEFSKVNMSTSKAQKDELEMYLRELDAFNDRIALVREQRRK